MLSYKKRSCCLNRYVSISINYISTKAKFKYFLILTTKSLVFWIDLSNRIIHSSFDPAFDIIWHIIEYNFLHAKPGMPDGEISIFTAVIH